MSDFVSLGIIFLSALAYASLQLNLGSLLSLYHASVGKHVTTKSRTLATGFIFGVSFFLLLAVAASCFYISLFERGSLELWLVSALCGALVAIAVIVWTIYYRFGGATELWLPRSVARFLGSRAKATNSPVESFSLGLMSCFAEIPFSLIVIILASNSILSLSSLWQFIMICIFTFIAVLPLLCLRLFIRKGSSISAIQSWRTKNKVFLRVFSGLLFIVLAGFIFTFEVMGKI